MIANKDYKNGSWDKEVPSVVSGTETITFTYIFNRSTTPVEPLDKVSYIVEHYKATDIGVYGTTADETEIFSGKVGDVAVATAKTYEGYAYDSSISIEKATLKAVNSNEDIVVLKLYYDIDRIGGGDDGDAGDGTPDKYQKKVIFKVVNGIWSNGTTEDIVQYLTLVKDGKYSIDGEAALVAPSGMIANKDYKNGSWDKEVPSVVSGTETLTYTHTFIRSTTPVEPLDKVSYIVEHYKENADGAYEIADDEIFTGKIGETVTATAKDYEGYVLNEEKSTFSGTLVKLESDGNILVLKLYYDIDAGNGGEDTPDTPDTPDVPVDPDTPDTPDVPVDPDTPDTPDVPVDPEDPTDPDAPVDPDAPGGEGEGEGNGSFGGGAHHILFGKTDGIGWYNVSKDGGQTWDIVFGNSTYEVENGTEIIVKVGDLMGDTFTFYVNGDKYYPDENGQLVITVNGYMLIGAISVVPEIDFEVPDVEESLNWFQRIIKAIKDFFAKLFGKN